MKKTLRAIFSTLFAIYFVLVNTTITANAVSKTASESIDGRIKECTLRTTEWTPIYKTSLSNTSSLGIRKDSKVKILEERNGRFKIKCSDNNYYWLDSGKVLINIAEYIPSISINLDMAMDENYFNMAGEDIPDLTNKRFYMSKKSRNGSECWLKYQPAKKLLKAEKYFLSEGYKIKVYDAYRPASCTQKFKVAYRKYLDMKSARFKSKHFGELGESWFLAQKSSSHNFGIALDLTLVDIKTNQELKMPSKMHTLDCSSAYYMWKDGSGDATKNALYLKSAMENAGFSYLKSEWWHFQDNTISKGNVIDVPN